SATAWAVRSTTPSCPASEAGPGKVTTARQFPDEQYEIGVREDNQGSAGRGLQRLRSQNLYRASAHSQRNRLRNQQGSRHSQGQLLLRARGAAQEWRRAGGFGESGQVRRRRSQPLFQPDGRA